MSVYNGERFLREAIDSIRSQTLTDIELVVVDDGSTDRTFEILDGITDPRLKTVRRRHAGLAAALNAGIETAGANLIARMDADDVAAPDRLRAQQQFMLEHPAVGVLGTAARIVDYEGTELGLWRPPADNPAIRKQLMRANPFVHSSIMFRRPAFEDAGGYHENMPRAQDYDLWLRMLPRVDGANLEEVLMVRRVGPDHFGTRSETEQIKWGLKARFDALKRGDYPARYALDLIRPLAALAAPGPVRQWVRRNLPGGADVAWRIHRSRTGEKD